MTCFVTALGLSVHGETPFAIECGARLPVGRKIGTVAPLNNQSLPGFRLDELDHDIVGDHAHGKAIDLGDGVAKRFSWCGASICSQRRHHRGDETSAAGAERTRGWEE
jgi:hypothetical protein